jgi:hypothetical protein
VESQVSENRETWGTRLTGSVMLTRLEEKAGPPTYDFRAAALAFRNDSGFPSGVAGGALHDDDHPVPPSTSRSTLSRKTGS